MVSGADVVWRIRSFAGALMRISVIEAMDWIGSLWSWCCRRVDEDSVAPQGTCYKSFDQDPVLGTSVKDLVEFRELGVAVGADGGIENRARDRPSFVECAGVAGVSVKDCDDDDVFLAFEVRSGDLGGDPALVFATCASIKDCDDGAMEQEVIQDFCQNQGGGDDFEIIGHDCGFCENRVHGHQLARDDQDEGDERIVGEGRDRMGDEEEDRCGEIIEFRNDSAASKRKLV